MKITLEDIDIAYARVCGHPPPAKIKNRKINEVGDTVTSNVSNVKQQLKYSDED